MGGLGGISYSVAFYPARTVICSSDENSTKLSARDLGKFRYSETEVSVVGSVSECLVEFPALLTVLSSQLDSNPRLCFLGEPHRSANPLAQDDPQSIDKPGGRRIKGLLFVSLERYNRPRLSLGMLAYSGFLTSKGALLPSGHGSTTK